MMRFADNRSVRVPRSCADAVHARCVPSDTRVSKVSDFGLAGRPTPCSPSKWPIIPAQKHIRTDAVCVITDPEELHRLNVWLYRKGLSLIAQIHCHPLRKPLLSLRL